MKSYHIWGWHEQGLLVKMCMRYKYVVGFGHIVSSKPRREHRWLVEPSVEEDGDASGFQPEGRCA